MQAVSFLVPAIAPLAIKLIDKYIFDDQQAPVPQIIQIPAPPQCACCCGQQSTDDYENNTDRSCSTCAPKSSSYCQHSKKSRLSTKSSVRSSSTSEAYADSVSCLMEKEESKRSIRSRSALRLRDDTGKVQIKSDKYSNVNTLDILAVHLKKEISSRHSKGKTSSRVPESRASEKTSSKFKFGSISGKSSSRSDHESKSSSSRKRNSDSDGLRVSKTARGDC